MDRKYYARHWHCGVATTGDDYHDFCSYHIFDTKQDRDNFVEDGEYIRSNSGYRDNVKASNPWLRRILNKDYFVYDNNELMVQ